MRKSTGKQTPLKRTRVAVAGKTASKGRVTVSRIGRQPFAPQREATLRYNDLIPVILTGSGTGSRVFSANGLFDPDITGTGHQPLYFDAMMGLYRHYVVTASRIKVTLSSTSAGPMLFSLGQNDDPSGPVTAVTLSEQPKSVSKLTIPTAGNDAMLRLSWSATRTFGVNPQANPELVGSSSANPAEGSFFQLRIQDQAVSSDTVDMFVEIEYDVRFFELVPQGSS